MPVLILFGSLAGGVLGSVIFANPALFRTILMTDWLFLFFFLAAIWLPAEIVSRKLARSESVLFYGTGEEETTSVFQNRLSSISLRFLTIFLVLVFGFLGVSGTRLIALTISKQGRMNRGWYAPKWILLQARMAIQEKRAVLWRLQRPPFSVIPEDDQQLSLYSGGKDLPSVGAYVVEIDGFYYDYYIPAGDSLPYRMLELKPYAVR